MRTGIEVTPSLADEAKGKIGRNKRKSSVLGEKKSAPGNTVAGHPHWKGVMGESRGPGDGRKITSKKHVTRAYKKTYSASGGGKKAHAQEKLLGGT